VLLYGYSSGGGGNTVYWTVINEVQSDGTTVIKNLATGTYASGTVVQVTQAVYGYALYVPINTLASLNSRIQVKIYTQASGGLHTLFLEMRGNTLSNIVTTIASNLVGAQGATGAQGSIGPIGLDGNSSVWQLNATAGLITPASGIFGANSFTNFSSVTSIRVNFTDFNSNNMTSWLTNCTSGSILKIHHLTNYTEYGFYTVGIVSSGASFQQLQLVYTSGSGTTPLLASNLYMISYVNVGPTGAQGLQGAQGLTGSQGSIGATIWTQDASNNISYSLGNVSIGTTIPTSKFNVKSTVDDMIIYPADTYSPNVSDATMKIGSTSGRSINATGTVNSSGADYAEYFTKDASSTIFAPGDICGIDSSGNLTKNYNSSISFGIISSFPSFVGGNSWTDETTVARVALCGRTVINLSVNGASSLNVGDYVIPSNPSGTIIGCTGDTILPITGNTNSHLDAYIRSIGRVVYIDASGQPVILIKSV